MDIFEFAIQMECDGQDYYRQLASKTTHNGIKKILIMLAEDELKHQQALEKARDTSSIMPETAVLTNAKNVFRQMKDFGGDIDLSGDEEPLYRHAMDLELKSRSFYRDKADQVQTPEQKDLFLKLAEEEKKHYHLLSDLIDFFTAPKTWLADAEFEHLDEY
jgi:rubrerythrin